ncbi:MAG: hypothetical protein GX968_01725 [Tissierellia bacterium]|nr:hypothetical protein [Tissierellia bacterium]
MVETKREIILEEGIPVEVFDKDMNLLEDTIALVGKATRQFFSEISLESHRQGQFFPELNIGNGLIVRNGVTDEDYIVVANYPEVIDRQMCTTIARMIVCNSKLTIKRMVETADRFGNIKREFKEVYKDLSIYAETLESKVTQKDPGKIMEVSYKIFAPGIEIETEDQIQIVVGGKEIPFKLTGYDPLTFGGLTLIEVVSETRR